MTDKELLERRKYHNLYKKLDRKNYPDKYKLMDRIKNLKKLGITLEEYNKLLEEQDNKCKICLKEETCINIKTNKVQHLCVDHSHATGKVRGLLCTNCNRAIGFLQEDTEFLKRAIEYITL